MSDFWSDDLFPVETGSCPTRLVYLSSDAGYPRYLKVCGILRPLKVRLNQKITQFWRNYPEMKANCRLSDERVKKPVFSV